jgi:hypothetical protein
MERDIYPYLKKKESDVLEEEVKIFVEKMKEKYNEKVLSYGHSWKTCDIDFLEQRLIGEFIEYIKSENPKELVDIANICWMLYSRKETKGD